MTFRRRIVCRLLAAAGCLTVWPATAIAQTASATTPGFSLASSTIFSTRESPAIYLTFERLGERLGAGRRQHIPAAQESEPPRAAAE